MKVACYAPNRLTSVFCEHVKTAEFTINQCDSDVDLIFAASTSQLQKAIRAKIKFDIPLACWVWDIPYDWREWCTDDWKEAYFEKNANKDAYVTQTVNGLKKCPQGSGGNWRIVEPARWQAQLVVYLTIDTRYIYVPYSRFLISRLR